MKKKKKGNNNNSINAAKENISEATVEENKAEESIVESSDTKETNELSEASNKEEVEKKADNSKEELSKNAGIASETDPEETESDAELSDFVKEIWSHIRKWISNNHRTCLIALAICAVAILVIVIVSAVTKQRDSQIVDASASMNSMMAEPSMNTAISVPQEPLQMNAYPEVNELIVKYFTAMQNDDLETLASLRDYLDTVEAAKIEVKCEYVEEYQNIVCYTKPGPFENSYIVYVVCDVKFVDWEVPAPSVLAKLVCTREDGSLYVYEGDFDVNVADYIKTVSSQQDVVDLITRVKTEYSELLDSNPEFAAYMGALNQTIKDEVGEMLAAETVSADSVSGDAVVSENEVAANTTEVSTNDVEQEEGGSFEVKTTTTVNVRMSDSEEADKMGRVEGGTVLVCNEQRANGWSQIVYEGEIGYIKSEYLVILDEEGNENQTATAGTVSVTETVNIRETPDTEGDKVGVAYAGETFTLIEDLGNGWTKIEYNGQDAYIKTEFIDN